MLNQKHQSMKALTGHIIAVLLVLLMMAVSILSILGEVDLANPAVSLFVGSLVGTISGLLASPLVFYYGAAPNLPPRIDSDGNGTNGNGP